MVHPNPPFSKRTNTSGREQIVLKMMQDTRNELEIQLDGLRTEYEKAKMEQLQTYNTFMAKLPPSIKSMTIGELKELHGLDMLSLIDQKRSGSSEPSVLATPSMDHRARSKFTTPGTIRRRESLFDGQDEKESLVATISRKTGKISMGLSKGGGEFRDLRYVKEFDVQSQVITLQGLQELRDMIDKFENEVKEGLSQQANQASNEAQCL